MFVSHSKKKRPPSSAEKFLLENKNPITQNDIEKNTSVKTRKVHELVDLLGGQAGDNFEWRKNLRKSLRYKQLKKEFSEEEIELFENNFLEMVSQFQEDLLSTEIDQMFQVIKLNLLISRNLEHRQNAKHHTERLERLIAGIEEKVQGDASKLEPYDRDQIIELEKQISSFRSVEESCTSDHVKLLKEYNDILKALKATREQRSKSLTDSKVSFTALIKTLQERDVLEKENRQLSLFQMSSEKEKVRLSELTEYMDGTVDHPILNADTMAMKEIIESRPEPEEKENE